MLLQTKTSKWRGRLNHAYVSVAAVSQASVDLAVHTSQIGLRREKFSQRQQQPLYYARLSRLNEDGMSFDSARRPHGRSKEETRRRQQNNSSKMQRSCSHQLIVQSDKHLSAALPSVSPTHPGGVEEV